MDVWLYILLLLIGPTIIVYTIELIKACSKTKRKTNDIITVGEKLQNGEKLDEYDKIILNEQIQKSNLLTDLDKRRNGK